MSLLFAPHKYTRMGVGLIIASLLCEDFWSVQSWCHFLVIEEGMKEDRSVWVGKSPGLMRGRWAACLTTLSTASLPGMPGWPGTRMKMTLDEVVLQKMSRMCIRLTKGWRESGFEMAEMEARESEIVRKIGVRMRSFGWWCSQGIEGWPGVRLWIRMQYSGV